MLHSQRYPSRVRGWKYNHLPVNDGSWRKVQIDSDWLEALTPHMDSNSSGSTSLAYVLKNMDITNHTDPRVTPKLEATIATLVADGMSRTGLRSISRAPLNFSDPLHLIADKPASRWGGLMKGSYSFPQPEGLATELKWSVSVSGYAYHADSNASRLALAVLFLHAALVIGHIIYIIRTRLSRQAWDSMISYVVLAAVSSIGMISNTGDKDEDSLENDDNSDTRDSSSVFKNASSGISRFRTMSTEVRVRAKTTNVHHVTSSQSASAADVSTSVEGGRSDQVKMIFGRTDENLLEKEGYRQIEIGKVYS
ncbi:MAG: hypothetical protein Q9214_003045 [Letrouitia sp. 1 TL-2023]